MRGRGDPQLSMLAVVDLDARIPPGHPLRVVKRLADRALAELSPVFDRMDAAGGRPSIPPERLLKASLLIALLGLPGRRPGRVPPALDHSAGRPRRSFRGAPPQTRRAGLWLD